MQLPALRLLPSNQYAGVTRDDPIHLYYWPILGSMYRRRVELCLAECQGGERILEVGFGSGVTFLNLNDMYREIHGLDLTASVEKVRAFFETMRIAPHLRNGNVLDMPYEDNFFDTVLLISILEHLKPSELAQALKEIVRVLKPGGRMVYGVPVERPLMVLGFRLLGYNIRKYHFSTEQDVFQAATNVLEKVKLVQMRNMLGPVYEVGHFRKPQDGQ